MADKDLTRAFMEFCEKEMGWKFVDATGKGDFVVKDEDERVNFQSF